MVAGVVLAMSLTGCGVLDRGVYDTPLPGGADVGSDPIRLTADFEDVLDLVPQSSVKVDNVAVGRVAEIRLNRGGRSARVTLVVNRDADLPEGTTARLQQTSLLGEKYVALVRPAKAGSAGELSSGDHIGLAKTSQAAEVEQVLGALSMVLNGGGIQQFQEISRELQQISAGRPEEIKAFLRRMASFVGQLDARKESITAALDGLNELSRTLNRDRDKIVAALDGLEPGMRVLVSQREQLVNMLEALDRLSTVTVRTLDAAQEDMVADLKALSPILDQLARAGADLPRSLEILLTYPFPDSVLGAIKGDYLNVFIETNFRTLPAGCSAIGCVWEQVADPNASLDFNTPATPAQRRRMRAPLPPLLPPTSSATPGLPTPTIPVPSDSLPEPSGSSSQPGSSSTGPTRPTDPTGPTTSQSPESPGSPGSPGSSGSTGSAGDSGRSPSPSGSATSGGE